MGGINTEYDDGIVTAVAAAAGNRFLSDAATRSIAAVGIANTDAVTTDNGGATGA